RRPPREEKAGLLVMTNTTGYAQRAVAYWAQSERAYFEGDPRYGAELAELAAQCEQWAYEDLTGVRSDVA
ncbi:hypothetical protein, partial [Gordonia sp. C13]|uniref:hypothetical protein n=1 Tax=Gordonia sp. C13 TaxID=2935078 RepID=UPI00200A6722